MNFNPRIAGAFLVGLLMMGGAFFLSRQNSAVDSQPIVAMATGGTDAPVRGFIPVDDNDADGLPDWQNTFDIATVYINEDPEDTLTKTGALAVNLATQNYLGRSSIDTILANVGTSLTKEMLDKDYTIDDIVIGSDNSAAALKIYGNEVAAIALRNAPPAGTTGELVVLNRALLRGEPEVLAELDPTIASYEKMLAEMLATKVPSSMTREHLSLINVYQALVNDIRAFRTVFDDALPAMTRFRRYQADAEALYTAIVLLYQKLDSKGIQWTEQDPASKFIEVG